MNCRKRIWISSFCFFSGILDENYFHCLSSCQSSELVTFPTPIPHLRKDLPPTCSRIMPWKTCQVAKEHVCLYHMKLPPTCSNNTCVENMKSSYIARGEWSNPYSEWTKEQWNGQIINLGVYSSKLVLKHRVNKKKINFCNNPNKSPQIFFCKFDCQHGKMAGPHGWMAGKPLKSCHPVLIYFCEDSFQERA